MRKNISPVWQVPLDKFQEIIQNAASYSDALKSFGLENKGGNINTLKRRIAAENIDVSHMEATRKERILSGLKSFQAIPLSKVLVENCPYKIRSFKQKLIKEGFLKDKCAECGIGPEWNGKSLSLQLDHINGVHNDNRLTNLRILCPNCHSQTETYSGKNVKRTK